MNQALNPYNLYSETDKIEPPALKTSPKKNGDYGLIIRAELAEQEAERAREEKKELMRAVEILLLMLVLNFGLMVMWVW